MDMGSRSTADADNPPDKNERKRLQGRGLPAIHANESIDWSDFRRVEVDIVHTIQDEGEAHQILLLDPNNAAANTTLGLVYLQKAESEQGRDIDDSLDKTIGHVKLYLGKALNLPSWTTWPPIGRLPPAEVIKGRNSYQNAESWYLLGRVYLLQEMVVDTYHCLQQAAMIDGRSTTTWITIGVLYYGIKQYRDSLDSLARAIRINPYIREPWYNLFVLVRRSVGH